MFVCMYVSGKLAEISVEISDIGKIRLRVYWKLRTRSNISFLGVFFGNFNSIAISPKLRSKIVKMKRFVKFMSQRGLFCRYRPRVLVWSFYIYLVKIRLVVNCVKMSIKVFKIGCFVTWLILSPNFVKIGTWMLHFSCKISFACDPKKEPRGLDFCSK